MNISKETVQYVAHLARISLSDKELEKFAGQLSDILGYIDQLKEIDISAIEPTAHVLPIKNVKRPDQLLPSSDVKEVLKNAPALEGTSFKVPRVIE